jgi:hypothetical protein
MTGGLVAWGAAWKLRSRMPCVLALLAALVLVGCSASHTLCAVQDGAVDQVGEPGDSGGGSLGSGGETISGGSDWGDGRGDDSVVADSSDTPVVPLDPSSPCYSSPSGACGGIPSYVEISGDGELAASCSYAARLPDLHKDPFDRMLS